jgi:hypothetical protein
LCSETRPNAKPENDVAPFGATSDRRIACADVALNGSHLRIWEISPRRVAALLIIFAVIEIFLADFDKMMEICFNVVHIICIIKTTNC